MLLAALVTALAAAGCVDINEPAGDEEVSSVAQGLAVPKRTRGTNTQQPLPDNLFLTDIDGDERSDLLQFVDNELFWVRTDFAQSYIGHSLLPRPINRLFTGDFMDRDQHWVCAILDDDSLRCYGARTDAQELWWAFTQSSFISAYEDIIVGDYDGNGRDDLLLYHRTSGAIRVFTIVGDSYFERMPSFQLGALENVAVAGMQFRAGEFNGDSRIDLLAINNARQIFRFDSVYAISKGGYKHSFAQAFVTGSVVGANEEVSVARVNNDRYDDIVLHDTAAGHYHFFAAEASGGTLTPLSDVAIGQLYQGTNSQLYWGRLHSGLSEYGSSYRDDALIIAPNSAMRRYDARWSGSMLTYWWAYTSYTPDPSTQAGSKLAYIARDVKETHLAYEVASIEAALTDAGYDTHLLGAATTMTDIFADLAAADLGPSDQVLFVGEGHGAAPTGNGINSTAADWAAHTFWVNDGTGGGNISAQNLGDLAALVMGAGASFIILDASCMGGATVRYIEERFDGATRVCAIATTGTVTPGLTGVPSFGDQLATLAATATIQDLANSASNQLRDMAHGPAFNGNLRVHQLGYTNGCSHSMRLREGLSEAYASSTTWPEWNRLRDVHVLLEPERYLGQSASPDAPEPNTTAAEVGWTDHTLRELSDMTGARQDFHASNADIPGETEMRGEVLEFATELTTWHAAFLALEDSFSSQTLLSVSLGTRLRQLLRGTVVGCVATSHYSRLHRYQSLACAGDMDGLVEAVLADYPALQQDYDKYEAAKIRTERELIEASTALAPVEDLLCEQASSPCSRMLAK